jgi:hypothetical protein
LVCAKTLTGKGFEEIESSVGIKKGFLKSLETLYLQGFQGV